MARKKQRHNSSAQHETIHKSHLPPLSTLTTPTPKKTKPRSHPGCILSMHNVPNAATEVKVRALFKGIHVMKYKRMANEETNALSEIVFLLFATLEDAQRAFTVADGRMLLGREIRMNFVNGIKFENMPLSKNEEELVGEDTI